MRRKARLPWKINTITVAAGLPFHSGYAQAFRKMLPADYCEVRGTKWPAAAYIRCKPAAHEQVHAVFGGNAGLLINQGTCRKAENVIKLC